MRDVDPGRLDDPAAGAEARSRGQWTYQIRCVYQRPLCGPLEPDEVSDPSPPFLIASFFDLDAPSRPIHISLPVDTGISDLRKLAQERQLPDLRPAAQADESRHEPQRRAQGSVRAAASSVDLGLICSFSIPIITICALIVLMIFVSLLNIVFWWLPFLRICFPIGLKARIE